MEIIPPIKLNLALAAAISAYVSPVWVTNTYYYRYDRVRRQWDGVWHDYQAEYSFYSTSGPPKPPYYAGYSSWRYLGLAATTSTQTYKTDFDLSENPAWTSGNAVAAGEAAFDSADRLDYIALTDIAAGSNTVRPSSAVVSSDETIAGYWTVLGAANAWAALDYELATKTRGISSGAISTADASMFIVPTNPSVNLIPLPNDFSVWGPLDATHSTSTENDPTGTSASISVITASGNGGIYRWIGGDYVKGAKYVFAFWAKSDNITSVVIDFKEDADYTYQTSFLIGSDAWRYYQMEYTVIGNNIDGVIILISGMASAGKNIKLWGAHWGLCADCFNRYALMGVKNCDLIKVSFLPYITPYNMTPLAPSTDHYFYFSAENRRDILKPNNIIHSFFTAGESGSYQVAYSNTDVIYLTNTSAFYLAMSPRNPDKVMEISSFAVGEATYIGGTEWGVETSMLSFSRKERNETFGTVTFVKRGTSKQVRATAFIDPDVISGDEVQAILSEFDGQPVFWDFNNEGSDYDRLRVFGFNTNVRMLIAADTYESLSLDIEGLVE